MKSTIIWFVVLIVIVGAIVYTTRNQTTEPEANLSSNLPTQTPMAINPNDITPINNTVAVTLKTSKGDIMLSLDGKAAPLTVGNFVSLVKQGFYNGTAFHRVIPGFMIQGGDPLSKDPSMRVRHGTGDPGYQFKDEFNARKIVRGEIAMANSGPGTNGSQFFIVVGEAFPHLDGKHTNFGTITSGMDIVDAIVNVPADANNNPLVPVTINEVIVAN